MQACIDDNAYEDGVAVWHEMRASGVRPTAVTFNQRLVIVGLQPSLTDLDAQDAAERVWAEMQQLGVKPNVECYHKLLAIRLRGQPDHRALAIQTIREMESSGLPVRTDTFNTIMAACISNGSLLQVRRPRLRSTQASAVHLARAPLGSI